MLTSFLDERGVSGYDAAAADPDASYRDVRHVDLAALEPYVARPAPSAATGCRSRSWAGRRWTRHSSGRAPTANSRTSRSPRQCCAARPSPRAFGCWSPRLPGRLPRGDAARLPAGHRRRRRCRHQLHLRRVLRVPHGRARTRRSVHHASTRNFTGRMGSTEAADLHGLTGHRRRIGGRRLHHRPKERDRMTLASPARYGCSATT